MVKPVRLLYLLHYSRAQGHPALAVYSAVVGTSKPGAAKAKLMQRAARRRALAGIATN